MASPAKSFIFISHRHEKSFYVTDFEDPPKGAMIYPHAIDMWNGQIDWNKVISILNTQCKGSQEIADQISQYLTLFKQIASGTQVGAHTTKNATSLKMTQDIELQNMLERNMLQQYHSDPQFQKFQQILGTVSTWTDSDRKAQGDILENFIEKTVLAAQGATNNPMTKGRVGQETVRSQAVLGTVNITVGAGQSIFKADKNGNLTNAIRDDIIAIVKQDLDVTGRMKKDLAVEVIKQNGNTYTLEVRIGQDKYQKIDEDFGSLVIIQHDNGFFNKFLSLMKGATFSVKNYNFGLSENPEERGEKRDIHFGDTGLYRKYGAFYFIASNGNGSNGADIGTFAFATQKSIEKGLHSTEILISYTKWVDYLYEVLGIGQKSDSRLVDYVIINNAGSTRDVVMVTSMKEFVSNLTPSDFQKPPSFVLNKHGMISVARSIGGISFAFS